PRIPSRGSCRAAVAALLAGAPTGAAGAATPPPTATLPPASTAPAHTPGSPGPLAEQCGQIAYVIGNPPTPDNYRDLIACFVGAFSAGCTPARLAYDRVEGEVIIDFTFIIQPQGRVCVASGVGAAAGSPTHVTATQ